jgi:ferrochelatase
VSAATPATTGVLLVNLGTPEAPTAGAIRAWLREFLSDRRVVEIPRLLWWPVLYGVILPLRPRRLAHAYAKIWRADGSPLMAISRRQAAALQAALGERAQVALAMRYGEPSIGAALADLEQRGARRIVVLPLYPQYSATTTATVLDRVFDLLRARRDVPALATIADYHDDRAYIAALSNSVRRHWEHAGRGSHLLMSFHSLPKRCSELGDPYERQCRATAQLLARELDLGNGHWTLSFQSRLGRAAWLEPYTERVLADLAPRHPTLDVICPGFSVDCLETLEEVAMRYAAQYASAGGTLRYVAALNEHPDHIEMLAALLAPHLQ